MDAVESHQGAHRELHSFGNLAGCAEVNLRYLVGSHAAGVLDIDVDIEAAIVGFQHAQAGVFERGVAEAVTEGEQRVDLFLVKPASKPRQRVSPKPKAKSGSIFSWSNQR